MTLKFLVVVIFFASALSSYSQEISWKQIFPTPSPSARAGASMAFDPVHSQSILFGGLSGVFPNFKYENDTWAWDGTRWVQMTPSSSPSPRQDYAVAYDTGRNQLVLFGGINGTTELNDTWIWDGTNWIQQFPATSPPARFEHAMAYDAAHNQIVLFGGQGQDANAPMGDIWTWDGTNWTEEFPNNTPSPRFGQAMAYDVVRHEVVMFGGADQGGLIPFNNNNWLWDGTNWTLASPSHNPNPRINHGMVFDNLQNKVVMFGGQGASILNDVWLWNGSDWEEDLSTISPAARQFYAFTYDSDRAQDVVFGGTDVTSAALGDTWLGSAALKSNNQSETEAQFGFVGHAQTWTVPDNVTSIVVDARGAQGGGNPSDITPEGGKGGRIQTTLAVTPGETLTINVGGRGGDLNEQTNAAGVGGFNGGGTGGIDNVDFNAPGGGGGGATDIRQGGDDLAHRVVVAGGGGGAECCIADSAGVGGEGGGLTGMAGGSNLLSSTPGGGGTQTNGGTAGGGCNGNGSSGSLGQGGVGGNGNRAGGGGGGGYYGGGGGGGCLFGSGGGGGASYSAGTDTIHIQGYEAGDGQIQINFEVAPSAPTVAGSPVLTNSAGQSTTGPNQSTTSTQGMSAEPVSTGNGNYYYSHADFLIPGRGLPVLFQRSYNTLDAYAGPLGTNWNHSLNVSLSQTAAGVASIRWGDGHGETFVLTGTAYVPQPGVYSVLVAHADGTYTLTQKNQTSYNFSAMGKLNSVLDKNGNAITLNYDANGNLIQVTDTVGRPLTLTYDASNRITQVKDAIGRIVQYAYDGNNNLASVTDPAGGVTQYAYDNNHHLTSIVQPNATMLLQNAYDSSGRVISQTNGSGFKWQFAYDTPSPGNTTITDARGNATIHTYDSSLRIVKITDPLGGTTSYAYDSNNNRTSVINADGAATAFAYDPQGNIATVNDPLGNTSTFSYDAKNNLLTATNPKGHAASFLYDANGNLTQTQDEAGNLTKFTYDSFGELTSKTDARGNATTVAYDAFGDLIQITDALNHSTSVAYDGIGRFSSVTDPNGHKASATYDTLSRLLAAKDALGNQTLFAYDAVGNLLKVTDANGHATNYTYDATNNLVSVTDALGHVTNYGYDSNNNRTSFTNAKGNTTSYAFDTANRLIKSTDPLSFSTSYSYDAAGNVLTTTDAKGQTNQFAYDALSRLVGIAYADGKSVSYAYDADDDRTSMVDWRGVTKYSYDILDRLISIVQPDGKLVSYSYDAVGNRTALTYPNGKVVGYTYDGANRLLQVNDWLSRATTYSYDTAGNLTNTAYPNGASIAYAYDAANRLISVVNAAKGGAPVLKLLYKLDATGNRTALSTDGIVTNFGYDPLNELVSAQLGPLKTTWSYDAVGNRIKQTEPILGTTTYAYDIADRMLRAGFATFTYDANGNQTSVARTPTSQPINYQYDAANRMIAAVGGLINSTYAYDGDGNRVLQSIPQGTYQYVNDVATALPVVLNEQGPDGSIDYAYGLGLIEENSPAFNYFYHYDGLGSVIALTDATGKPQAAYAYDPWGNPLLTITDRVGTKNKFRFTGEALDPATGLYFLRARYYDPVAGRFLARDRFSQLLLSSNANRYTYSLNNPIRFHDPSGFLTFAVGVSATAAGGIGGLEGDLLLVYDDQGNRALEYDVGSPLGLELSVGQTLVLTNDPTIYALKGKSFSIGGSVGESISVGGDLLFSNGQYNGVSYNISVGYGAPINAAFTTGSLFAINSPWLNIFPAQPFLSWSTVQSLIEGAQPTISTTK